MASRGESPDPIREPEGRIARARSAISAGLDELRTRGEVVPPHEHGGPGDQPAPVPAEGPVGRADPILAAAIDARFEAAESALRSRLDAALSEGRRADEERIRSEAAAHRKRLEDELATALRNAATDFRRELEAERADIHRELDATARAGAAAAIERIDALRAAAVRDAARTAEEVSGSRLRAVRESLTADLRHDLEEARSGIDRDAAAVEARVWSLIAGLRDEQAAAAAKREDEARRRIEARLGLLDRELSERIDRELERGLATARAVLEDAGATALASGREEIRAGAGATVEREVAKGEARLAATAAGIEAAIDERFGAALEAAERGLEASAQGAIERALAAIRPKLEEAVARAAQEAVAAAAQGATEELQQALITCTGEQLELLRAEAARGSYREYARRAETASAAQLEGSLAALERRAAELAGALDAAAERSGRSLDDRATGIRAAAAADLERRVEGAAAAAVGHRVARATDDARATLRGEEARIVGELGELGALAERRIAGAEHALEREDRIRERTRAAELEAAARVREAERRLAAVLGQLDRRGTSSA